MSTTDDDRPRMLVVPPGAGEQHWQPQPANGWIEVLTSPRTAGAPRSHGAGGGGGAVVEGPRRS